MTLELFVWETEKSTDIKLAECKDCSDIYPHLHILAQGWDEWSFHDWGM